MALRAQLGQLESALLAKTAQLAAEQDSTASAQGRADAAEAQIAHWTAEAEALGKQVAELQVRASERNPPLRNNFLIILSPTPSTREALSPTVTRGAITLISSSPQPHRGSHAGPTQERLGHGEFNAATTRVLHFIQNPEAEARREAEEARLAELQAENAALRSQLQRVEAQAQAATPGAAPTPTAAGATSIALAEAEITLLKRKARHLFSTLFATRFWWPLYAMLCGKPVPPHLNLPTSNPAGPVLFSI